MAEFECVSTDFEQFHPNFGDISLESDILLVESV